MTDEELIDIARQYRKHSYSPYSRFKVGAAVLTPGERSTEAATLKIPPTA